MPSLPASLLLHTARQASVCCIAALVPVALISSTGILRTRSEFFRALFQPRPGCMQTREADEKEIPLPGVPKAVLLDVMEYLYTGIVTLDESRSQQLLLAGLCVCLHINEGCPTPWFSLGCWRS